MEIKCFEATLLDGTTVTNQQYSSVSQLPHDQVKALKVEVGTLNSPNKVFLMKADPTKGERLHFFIRRAVRLVNGVSEGRFSVFVMEISRQSERLARLYIPETGEPIFTTEDIYF